MGESQELPGPGAAGRASVGRVTFRSFLVSLARILTILIGLFLVFAWVIRQPNTGRLPFPPGPRADSARLEAHVRFLASLDHPRNYRHPAHLDRAARYIAEAFAQAGAQPTEQPYRAWGVATKNIIAH